MPIEVFVLAEPQGPPRYGLISGFRRLAAFRSLAGPSRQDPLRHHPRLRPHPKDTAEALPPDGRGERHPRRGLPWDRPSSPSRPPAPGLRRLDAAIEALYTNLSRHKRPASAPSPISPRSSTAPSPPPRPCPPPAPPPRPAIHRGYGDLIRATLTDTERPRRRMARPAADPRRGRAPRARDPTPPRPGRPRRILDLPRASASAASAPARLGPALHRPRRHQRHARLRLRRHRAPVQPARGPRTSKAPPAGARRQ